MKAVSGISKAYWDGLRQHLQAVKESLGGWEALGQKLGCKGNTLKSFALGRAKGLARGTWAKLDAAALLLPEAVVENPPTDPWAVENRIETLERENRELKARITELERRLEMTVREGALAESCPITSEGLPHNQPEVEILPMPKVAALAESCPITSEGLPHTVREGAPESCPITSEGLPHNQVARVPPIMLEKWNLRERARKGQKFLYAERHWPGKGKVSVYIGNKLDFTAERLKSKIATWMKSKGV